MSYFNTRSLVPAKGGHVSGEGVVGKHQEVNTHLLVVLDGRERARGGLATAAGGGGGLLPAVAVLRRWLGPEMEPSAVKRIRRWR